MADERPNFIEANFFFGKSLRQRQSEVFYKKAVLKNFTKLFTGTHCHGVLFSEVAGLLFLWDIY